MRHRFPLGTIAVVSLVSVIGCREESAGDAGKQPSVRASPPAPPPSPPPSSSPLPSPEPSPEPSPAPLPLIEAGVPFHTCTARAGKVVTLTFDDGPSPYSNELLDALAQAKVPATFFLKGDNLDEGNPQRDANRLAVKRMQDEGYEICNHTFSHPNLTTLTDDDVVQEMQRSEDLIADVTGRRTRCMRPPYSAYDDRILGILKSLGYSVVMWSFDSEDWHYASTEFPDEYDPEKMLATVTDAVATAKPPLIHIQHDNEFTQASVEMVPQVIDEMRKGGFEFVTLAECLGGATDVPK